MTFNFVPFVISWAAFATVVIALAIYRKVVSSSEDDTLHVLHGASATVQQVAVAHKLESIDKWGKILTVATVLYGIGIGCLYFYQLWITQSTAIVAG